jgi:hypothetical protein
MAYFKPILACLGIIILFFIAVSLLDILIAVIYPRFYSNAAFVVTFGVGGVFAAAFGYTASIPLAPVKNEFARWSLIILMIVTGLLFFFFLAKLEGGEYEAAFKAFGATLAPASLLFMKGKVE